MPILRVPVVHKFGIISHSQRLELQERLLKEAYSKLAIKHEESETSKNPYEINEDFIKKYNASLHTKESIEFEGFAQKILNRVKRRIGLTTGSLGPHVNIPFGWTELTLLAQCNGPVHQDCLNSLLLSLNQAPVHQNQVPALFYLAETVLYWLQTDSMVSIDLKSSEVKLLLIGELVFFRLYHHNICGHLQQDREAKTRLAIYLEGFDNFASTYSTSPDSHLSFSYISSVGKELVAELVAEVHHVSREEEFVGQGSNLLSPVREESSNLDVTSDRQQQVQLTEKELVKSPSGESRPISDLTTEVHDISRSLWHSLDVWRCVRGQGGDLARALGGLCQCADTIRGENWINAYAATAVLSDASKVSMETLEITQAILSEILYNYKAPLEENTSISRVQLVPEPSEVLTSRMMAEDATSKPDDITTDPALSQKDVHPEPEVIHQSTPAPDILIESPWDLWSWQVGVAFIQALTQVVLQGSTSQIRMMALTSKSGTSLVELTAYFHSPNQRPGGQASYRSQKEQHEEEPNDWSWRIRYSALRSLVVIAEACQGDPARDCMKNAVLEALHKARSKERDSRVLDAIKNGQIHGSLEQLVNNYMKSTRPTFLPHRMAHSLALLYLPPLAPPLPLSNLGSPSGPTPRKPSVKSSRGPLGPLSQTPLPGDKIEKAFVPGIDGKPQQGLRTTLKQEIKLAKSIDPRPDDYFKRQDFSLFRLVEDQWRKDLHMQMEQEEEQKCAAIEAQQAIEQDKLAKLQTYKTNRAKKTSNKT